MRITIETEDGGVRRAPAEQASAARDAAGRESASPPPEVAAAAAAAGAIDGGPAPTAPGPAALRTPSAPVAPLAEMTAPPGDDATSAGPAPGAAVEGPAVEVPAEDGGD